MYDVKVLQDEFKSLIGIRQSNVPGVPEVQSPLSDSLTGIYADDKNALCSTENLYYSSPNLGVNSYPVWGSGNTYNKGVAVSNFGILYIALNTIVNDSIQPPDDLDNWSLYYPFQIWLQQKYNQAVSNLFDEVFKRKKLLNMSKAILERQQLYRGSGSIHNKIIPQGRFVGFEIYPQPAEGLWVYIDQVGFQATDLNPNMRFYLYHCDEQDQDGLWIVNINKSSSFLWSDLNIATPWISGGSYLQDTIVNYSNSYFKALNSLVNDTIIPPSDSANWISVSKPSGNCVMKYLKHNTSGVYYFGYYEDDVIGNAISKDWNCSSAPCYGCDGSDIQFYNQWSRFTTLRNIQVPSSALNEDRTLFDTSKISYGSITNWGMNLSITVRCNMTDYIIYNKYQFAPAFAMQVCKELLEAIAKGIRIGPNPAQTKISAIADLDEKAPGNWIKKQGGYLDTIDALNIDMSGFSKACLPCDDSKKVKFFSM